MKQLETRLKTIPSRCSSAFRRNAVRRIATLEAQVGRDTAFPPSLAQTSTGSRPTLTGTGSLPSATDLAASAIHQTNLKSLSQDVDLVLEDVETVLQVAQTFDSFPDSAPHWQNGLLLEKAVTTVGVQNLCAQLESAEMGTQDLITCLSGLARALVLDANSKDCFTTEAVSPRSNAVATVNLLIDRLAAPLQQKWNAYLSQMMTNGNTVETISNASLYWTLRGLQETGSRSVEREDILNIVARMVTHEFSQMNLLSQQASTASRSDASALQAHERARLIESVALAREMTAETIPYLAKELDKIIEDAVRHEGSANLVTSLLALDDANSVGILVRYAAEYLPENLLIPLSYLRDELGKMSASTAAAVFTNVMPLYVKRMDGTTTQKSQDVDIFAKGQQKKPESINREETMRSNLSFLLLSSLDKLTYIEGAPLAMNSISNVIEAIGRFYASDLPENSVMSQRNLEGVLGQLWPYFVKDLCFLPLERVTKIFAVYWQALLRDQNSTNSMREGSSMYRNFLPTMKPKDYKELNTQGFAAVKWLKDRDVANADATDVTMLTEKLLFGTTQFTPKNGICTCEDVFESKLTRHAGRTFMLDQVIARFPEMSFEMLAKFFSIVAHRNSYMDIAQQNGVRTAVQKFLKDQNIAKNITAANPFSNMTPSTMVDLIVGCYVVRLDHHSSDASWVFPMLSQRIMKHSEFVKVNAFPKEQIFRLCGVYGSDPCVDEMVRKLLSRTEVLSEEGVAEWGEPRQDLIANLTFPERLQLIGILQKKMQSNASMRSCVAKISTSLLEDVILGLTRAGMDGASLPAAEPWEWELILKATDIAILEETCESFREWEQKLGILIQSVTPNLVYFTPAGVINFLQQLAICNTRLSSRGETSTDASLAGSKFPLTSTTSVAVRNSPYGHWVQAQLLMHQVLRRFSWEGMWSSHTQVADVLECLAKMGWYNDVTVEALLFHSMKIHLKEWEDRDIVQVFESMATLRVHDGPLLDKLARWYVRRNDLGLAADDFPGSSVGKLLSRTDTKSLSSPTEVFAEFRSAQMQEKERKLKNTLDICDSMIALGFYGGRQFVDYVTKELSTITKQYPDDFLREKVSLLAFLCRANTFPYEEYSHTVIQLVNLWKRFRSLKINDSVFDTIDKPPAGESSPTGDVASESSTASTSTTPTSSTMSSRSEDPFISFEPVHWRNLFWIHISSIIEGPDWLKIWMQKSVDLRNFFRDRASSHWYDHERRRSDLFSQSSLCQDVEKTLREHQLMGQNLPHPGLSRQIDLNETIYRVEFISDSSNRGGNDAGVESNFLSTNLNKLGASAASDDPFGVVSGENNANTQLGGVNAPGASSTRSSGASSIALDCHSAAKKNGRKPVVLVIRESDQLRWYVPTSDSQSDFSLNADVDLKTGSSLQDLGSCRNGNISTRNYCHNHAAVDDSAEAQSGGTRSEEPAYMRQNRYLSSSELHRFRHLESLGMYPLLIWETDWKQLSGPEQKAEYLAKVFRGGLHVYAP